VIAWSCARTGRGDVGVARATPGLWQCRPDGRAHWWL
jgi:hypothetical protein